MFNAKVKYSRIGDYDYDDPIINTEFFSVKATDENDAHSKIIDYFHNKSKEEFRSSYYVIDIDFFTVI